jgi:threonine dehydrogenase-like Zn-dependent dehydrogenase
VLGGGTIGLLAGAVAQAAGHRVDVECRHDHQRRVADALDHGHPRGAYDVVLDAAGSATSLARAAEAARPGGRIVSLGIHADVAPIPGTPSLTKELTYIHSMAYGRHDGVRETEQAARSLAGRPELASALITHRFPIDRADEAFRAAADRASGAIKVVVEP